MAEDFKTTRVTTAAAAGFSLRTAVFAFYFNPSFHGVYYLKIPRNPLAKFKSQNFKNENAMELFCGKGLGDFKN